MYKKEYKKQQGKPLHIVYSNTVYAKQQQQECYIEIWSLVTSLYSILSGLALHASIY